MKHSKLKLNKLSIKSFITQTDLILGKGGDDAPPPLLTAGITCYKQR